MGSVTPPTTATPPPTIITAPGAAGAQKAEQLPAIELLPFDCGSDAQAAELARQREVCGWKRDMVPVWQEMQRDGRISMFWVVGAFSFSF
jgi:hypothetical protein